MHLVYSLLGILLILGIAFALSTNRRAIRLRVVGAAFALQAGLAALVLYFPPGKQVLQGMAAGVSSLLGSKAFGRSKNEPFESGMLPTGGARLRLSAKFYLVAMLFVIFDVEALFLFAWSVSVRESGWAGFIEATLFIAILLAGLVYLWRIGALDWAPESRRKRQAKLKQ